MEKKSKINVKQEQRIGKFVRDFSIVVQDERSVNYNILRNMLRELLNSQSQPEKKTLEQIKGEFDKERVKEWDKTAIETYKQATQDAPEEWKELFAEWGLWSLVEDISDDGDGHGDNLQLTKEGREAYRMIKGLLEERERWAIDTFLKDTASYNSFHNGRPRTMRNGLSGEGFEVRVSKLNK